MSFLSSYLFTHFLYQKKKNLINLNFVAKKRKLLILKSVSKSPNKIYDLYYTSSCRVERPFAKPLHIVWNCNVYSSGLFTSIF